MQWSQRDQVNSIVQSAMSANEINRKKPRSGRYPLSIQNYAELRLDVFKQNLPRVIPDVAVGIPLGNSGSTHRCLVQDGINGTETVARSGILS